MWFEDWPEPSQIQFTVVSLDPSLGATEKADYSAFIIGKLDVDGVLWVECDAERRDSTSMVNRACALALEHSPQAFGVEAVGFQTLLCSQFAEACKRHSYTLPVWPMQDNAAKVARIRRLTPFLARKEIRIRRNPGGVILMEQLRAFPGHRHDDAPDSLEQCVRLCQMLHGGVGQQAPEERVEV